MRTTKSRACRMIIAQCTEIKYSKDPYNVVVYTMTHMLLPLELSFSSTGIWDTSASDSVETSNWGTAKVKKKSIIL